MRIPIQAKPVMRNISTARIEAGVNSSVNIGCLLTKCAPCAVNLTTGNIPGAILCAVSNCPQCI